VLLLPIRFPCSKQDKALYRWCHTNTARNRQATFHRNLSCFGSNNSHGYLEALCSNTATVIGNIAVLFCILMFASPLSVIQLVIRTKSAGIIPLPFTVVTCLNCFCWVVFGWFTLKDINVWLPNILGLAFGIIQVILKLVVGGRDNTLPAYSGVDIAP
jgi:uncharacterized protein with PQ loop repeat